MNHPCDPHRPRWHFSPRRNWINDPNGLVWFDGEYHLFCQFNPFGDQWGHMSWAHAVSTDLVNWQELPVAIPEDERVSIFSGSVVVDEANSSGFGEGHAPPLVAIYTGALRRNEGGQAQELAYSNDRGRTWTKYAHNPVLDLGLRDFRDPKVFWHEGTQRWVMAVVLPDDRRVQFYASGNLKQWTLLSEFDAPFEGQGIWECPDLFPLPTTSNQDGPAPWLFKVDVLAGHPSGGSGARIFFGHFDGTRFVPFDDSAPTPQWADWGADFYAALSWANLPPNADGSTRALWLAWMNCHRYAKHLPTSPWRGAMSVPRELRARRGADRRWQILQQPAAEVTRLRGAQQAVPATTLRNTVLDVALPAGSDGHALDIELTLTDCSAVRCGLRVRVGAAEHTEIGYDAAAGSVYVDRSRSGYVPPDDDAYAEADHAPVAHAPGPAQPLKLRVLLDACLLEVYVNDGECVISEQIFPQPGSCGLQLYAEGGHADFAAGAVHAMA